MLRLVDRDVFCTVTRLGSDAADSLACAIAGAPFDESTTTRVIDKLVARAEGISTLPEILDELRVLRDWPLWASAWAPLALERIERLGVGADRRPLDLLAVREAQASVLAGDYRARPFLESLGRTFIDRTVMVPRGGFVERHGGGEKLQKARSIVEPVARKLAAILEARPGAKRLGLTEIARVTADTMDIAAGHDDAERLFFSMYSRYADELDRYWAKPRPLKSRPPQPKEPPRDLFAAAR